MKLRFSLTRGMLVLGLIQALTSFTASAESAFPIRAEFYSSTDFKTASQVKRQLFYQSAQGSRYQFQDTNNKLKLIASSQNGTLFADLPAQGQAYAQEKQLLASTSLEQVEELKELIAELDEDIAAVQAKIQAATTPDVRAKLAADKLTPLNQQKKSVQSRLNSLNAQVRSIQSLPVLSLLDLFKKQRSGNVIVLKDQHLYLLTSVARRVNSAAVIAKNSSQAREYSYVTRSYVKLGAKSAKKGRNEAFFKVEKIANTNTAFTFDKQLYTLQRIQDKKVDSLLTMIKANPVEPTAFDFKGDVLTTSYQWKKSSSESKSLSVEYKYTGKKKNLIQVKTEAETEVYDPKTASANIVKHIGILAPTKSGALLELKKVQKTNNKNDGGWLFDYKKRLLKLGDQVLVIEKENYYGFEGLWYLAYWMNENNIRSESIYLINGLEPVALTANFTGKNVEFTLAGKVMYRFTFDSAKFVSKLEFVPEQQVLTLVSKDTTTTKKNRDKLVSYMKQNGIVKL